jgi:hypothetical protein
MLVETLGVGSGQRFEFAHPEAAEFIRDELIHGTTILWAQPGGFFHHRLRMFFSDPAIPQRCPSLGQIFSQGLGQPQMLTAPVGRSLPGQPHLRRQAFTPAGFGHSAGGLSRQATLLQNHGFFGLQGSTCGFEFFQLPDSINGFGL